MKTIRSYGKDDVTKVDDIGKPMKSVLRRKEVWSRCPGKQSGDRPRGPEHISILLCVRECLLASRVPVRESGRLRPLVAGYTAEKCSAEAENAFRRRVPGRGMDDRCLTRHLVTPGRDNFHSRWNCNEVSLQTHELLSPTGHTNRKMLSQRGCGIFSVRVPGY